MNEVQVRTEQQLSFAWAQEQARGVTSLDERIAAAEDVWAAVAGPAAAPPPAPEPVWAPRTAYRTDALLMHEIELADVDALLAALGADTVSERHVEAAALEGWERSPRLIVAAGRSALRLTLATTACIGSRIRSCAR